MRRQMLTVQQRQAKAQKDVDDWNAKYVPGCMVVVELDSGDAKVTKTRSRAQVMCGAAVVWLDGVTGCYALDRVKAVKDFS